MWILVATKNIPTLRHAKSKMLYTKTSAESVSQTLVEFPYCYWFVFQVGFGGDGRMQPVV
jgi:hypothetical protein